MENGIYDIIDKKEPRLEDFRMKTWKRR